MDFDMIKKMDETLRIAIIKIYVMNKIIELKHKDREKVKEVVKSKPTGFFMPTDEDVENRESFEEFIEQKASEIIKSDLVD